MSEEQENILRDAFARASAAHIAIDVQKAYCTPDTVRDRFRYYASTQQGLLAVPGNIADFSGKTRDAMKQGWVVWYEYEARREIDDRDVTQQMIRDALVGQNVRADDVLVNKGKRNAFGGSALHYEMAKRGIDTLVLSGIYMEQCVKETAEGALRKGYKVFVLEDLTVPGLDEIWDGPASASECAKDMRAQGIHVVKADAVLRIAGL